MRYVEKHNLPSTKKDGYSQVIALASHRINAVKGWHIEEELSWNGSAIVGEKKDGIRAFRPVLGGSSSSSFSLGDDGFWTTASKFTSCAYAAITYKMDPEIWDSGLPAKSVFVVEGCPVVMLRSPQFPVQSVVAAEIDEDQPFVSRAMNGSLVRVTTRVRKLWNYANERMASVDAAEAAIKEMDVAINEEDVWTDPKSPGSPERPIDRKQASNTLPTSACKAFDMEAIAGVKAYLDDGYDPRLIVEQLAVLRRAQRLRRPGRLRKGDADQVSVWRSSGSCDLCSSLPL